MTSREDFIANKGSRGGEAEFTLPAGGTLTISCPDYASKNPAFIHGSGVIYYRNAGSAEMLELLAKNLQASIPPKDIDFSINGNELCVSFPNPTIDETDISRRLEALYDAVATFVRTIKHTTQLFKKNPTEDWWKNGGEPPQGRLGC